MSDKITWNNFYNEVSKEVRSELEARSNQYKNTSRADNVDFIYEKSAYGKIRNVDTGHSISTLKGGFADDTLYRKQYGGHYARPVINSISSTNQGRFGSISSVTVEFTVFNLQQLDDIEPHFLVPGNQIEVEWGWTKSLTSQDVNRVIFEGIVYNFSFEMKETGGFSCQLQAVGKGFFILGMKMPQLPSDANPDGNLETAEKQRTAISLGSYFKNGAIVYTNSDDSFANESSTTTVVTQPILKIKNPGKTELGSFSKDDQAEFDLYVLELSGQNKFSYVTLETIIQTINKFSFDVLSDPDVFNISCNREYTRGPYIPNLFSVDPTKLILPSKQNGYYSSYEPTVDEGKQPEQYIDANIPELSFVFTDEQGTTAVDLSHILINVETLEDIEYELYTGDNDIDGTPYSYSNGIRQFLDGIFTMISRLTGGAYQLTLIESQDQLGLSIVNVNHHSVETVKPLVFSPFNYVAGKINGLRAMNLKSDVPPAFATAMFVGGTGAVTRYTKAGRTIYKNKTVTQEELKSAKEAQEDEIYYIYRNLLSCKPKVFNLFNESDENERVSIITEAMKAMDNYCSSEPTVFDKKPWQDWVAYPFEYSVTLDGISGFQFGNVIESDYLPERYLNSDGTAKIVFVVTNIEHKIESNDWTTTITAQCRLKSNEPNLTDLKVNSYKNISDYVTNYKTVAIANAIKNFNQ